MNTWMEGKSIASVECVAAGANKISNVRVIENRVHWARISF